MDKIKLDRNVFDKKAFNDTIDIRFKQLVSVPNPAFFDINLATVDDFFILYNKLFYEIPKNGDLNSHEYIIKTSSEYINYSKTNEDIQVLLDEIASLRQELLDIQISSIEEKALASDNLSSFSKDLNKIKGNTAKIKNNLTRQ